MIIDWPNNLVSDIARRRCVVFLGSGISAQASNALGTHPKTWRHLLEAARDTLLTSLSIKTEVTRLLDEDKDFLTACQLIKDSVRQPDFHDFLRREYLSPGFAAARVHDIVMRLDSRIYATPNFDKIFETYINHVQNSSVIIKHYYEGDLAVLMRGTDTVVIKIHGSVDTLTKAIFTRREYAEARTAQRAFYSIIEALAITHTFLFLGCGLNDPDIRLLLEDYAFTHAGRPHYFVLPDSAVDPVLVPTVESSLNISILSYDPIRNHENLSLALDELVNEVDSARVDIQATAKW